MTTDTAPPKPNAGKSFQAYCGIGPQDPGCVEGKEHTFDDGTTTGRCMTRYTCQRCGVSKYVDSSD